MRSYFSNAWLLCSIQRLNCGTVQLWCVVCEYTEMKTCACLAQVCLLQGRSSRVEEAGVASCVMTRR